MRLLYKLAEILTKRVDYLRGRKVYEEAATKTFGGIGRVASIAVTILVVNRPLYSHVICGILRQFRLEVIYHKLDVSGRICE